MHGTVLISDGVATSRILLKAHLAPSGLDMVCEHTGADLVDRVGPTRPALILIADNLPDMTATDLIGKVLTAAEDRDIPIIVVTNDDNPAQRLALLQAGADEVFAKPLSAEMLQARVRSLIRARIGVDELTLRDNTSRALGFAEAQSTFSRGARVTILSDDAAGSEAWTDALGPLMRDVRLTSLRYDDLLPPSVDTGQTDVFVVALKGNSVSRGLRLLADIKASPATRHAGVLVVLEDNAQKSLAADALDLGAADLMLHGFDSRELAQRLTSCIAQKQTQDQLRNTVENGLRAAVLDPMTGLYNRRYAMPYLSRVVTQCIKNKRDFAVMMADIDHFKSVNDCYGHAAGDLVLTEAARRLKDSLRAEDLIARMGGEEFLIVLPETGRADAEFAAERLRRRFASTQFCLPRGSAKVAITISVGVAVSCRANLTKGTPAQSAERLLHLADSALYDAKDAGRNQIALIQAA